MPTPTQLEVAKRRDLIDKYHGGDFHVHEAIECLSSDDENAGQEDLPPQRRVKKDAPPTRGPRDASFVAQRPQNDDDDDGSDGGGDCGGEPGRMESLQLFEGPCSLKGRRLKAGALLSSKESIVADESYDAVD
ncbi:hypothetical protein M885DRAFT_627056 [Pelagophyceae sp. CCMP2097]|nr:hypothetical protein M885DRAFT_627056 [Pelagophyceae sp. CCMP2097]|mmetsp:Transcript_21097/g.71420  ORF Transcript_21097/g.71420 Transcript_21097/m.71420 type:complete len:133 (-) Transcript_21097:377-775(-)